MKQAFIVFVIALVIGSILNSLGPDFWNAQPARDTEQSGLLQVTDKTFKAEVLDSDKPVLVDFWAPWCGPCKALAPTVAEVAKEYEGKVKVVKLNVDDAHQTADAYNVHSIPALLVFKKGKVVEQLVGAAPKEDIVALIEKGTKSSETD